MNSIDSITSSTFLPIPGFEDYEISDHGEIRKVTTGRTVKAYAHNSGYIRVNLARGGKQLNRLVHRLLLQTHAPVPGCDKLTVNHISGDKLDNRLSNLEFCTIAENTTHSRTVLGNRASGATRPVSLCDGRSFPSMTAAARALGRSVTTVNKAITLGYRVAGFAVSAVSAGSLS